MTAMTAIHACRACDGEKLTLVLSLGETPLANSLVEPARRSESSRYAGASSSGA